MIRLITLRLTLLLGVIILFQNISFSQAPKKTNYDALWQESGFLGNKKRPYCFRVKGSEQYLCPCKKREVMTRN